MAFDRLTWRVGLPFVLLVLLTTGALAAYIGEQIDAEERARFEQVAAANAAFVDRASLPTSARLAADLRQVTGYRVGFRSPGALTVPVELQLPTSTTTPLPADGRAQRRGAFELLAVPVPFKDELVLAREVRSTLLHPRVVQVLGAFWLLALLTAWLVGRALVRPLRQLAAQLPHIEQPGALDLPAAARNDEIGDLARAFVRTAKALQQERDERQRVEKLAVLGRMTAALAHEVQNPVAAIRMHAQLWRQVHGDEPAATIEAEAERIESLLNQWMFLTRPEAPVLAPLDVGALLQQLVTAQRPQTEHAAVRVELALAGDLTTAADKKRLEQVFRNLLNNAVQAMPSGGVLVIRGERDHERLRITFADHGTGFSPKALAHFAEFFYSEKEGGMGIGLSVAQEIRRAHGGSLHAENRAGGGASVTAELPVRGPSPA